MRPTSANTSRILKTTSFSDFRSLNLSPKTNYHSYYNSNPFQKSINSSRLTSPLNIKSINNYNTNISSNRNNNYNTNISSNRNNSNINDNTYSYLKSFEQNLNNKVNNNIKIIKDCKKVDIKNKNLIHDNKILNNTLNDYIDKYNNLLEDYKKANNILNNNKEHDNEILLKLIHYQNENSQLKDNIKVLQNVINNNNYNNNNDINNVLNEIKNENKKLKDENEKLKIK